MMLGLRVLNWSRGTRWMNRPAGLAALNITILWPVIAGRTEVKGCINPIPLPERAPFDPVVLSTKVFSDVADPDLGTALTTWMELANQKKVSECISCVHNMEASSIIIVLLIIQINVIYLS